jgi:phage baseplate assembly protein gpV
MLRDIMNKFRALIRRDIEAAIATVAQPRFATISSVDPANHAVRVLVQPEGIMSAWIPDSSAVMASGGFGVVAPCGVGDQVKVIFSHGDSDHPVVVGRVFSTVDMPPTSPVTGKAVQPGEFGVFTRGGAWTHYPVDGSVHTNAPQGMFIVGNTKIIGNLEVTLDATIDGDLSIEGIADGSTGGIVAKGNITDLAGSHGTLEAFRETHNIHVHPGIERGDDSTDATTQTQ